MFWVRWIFNFRSNGLTSPQRFVRIGLGVILPLLCGIFLVGVLAKMSSADVRSDREMVIQYCALGLAWVGATQWVFAFLGVSVRDDVIERRNPAAAVVNAGQLVGATCCFAGANIGNGPGVEVVLFCAMLSTFSLLLLWVVLDRIAWIVDTVTIERNIFTGVRVAGWLIGTGIVLSGGIAGDWYSASRTLIDFGAYAWPATVLTAAAAFLEVRSRKGPANSWTNQFPHSAAIGIGYVVLAGLYVYERGLF
jgi:uncharacterized membrane protein YjfL (UPF0719 family)